MEFLILKSILPLHFAFTFAFCILHLHLHLHLHLDVIVVVGVVGHGDNSGTPLHFAIAFECLNFPPKNLDVIVVVGVGVGHGDNSGTSFNWHFSVKPIR